LGRSRQSIADYRFCTAGGNEDDVAGFHLCQHCLAARLGRTVAHTNFFAEFARRDHNCRPALSGSVSQLHQQFVYEMVNGNQLPILPRRSLIRRHRLAACKPLRAPLTLPLRSGGTMRSQAPRGRAMRPGLRADLKAVLYFLKRECRRRGLLALPGFRLGWHGDLPMFRLR
jgi:hypothetical protein